MVDGQQPEPEKVRYRVLEDPPEGQIRVIGGGELLDAKYCYEPAPAPDLHWVPHGEWYCRNAECIVREVHIRAKLLDEEDVMPQAFTCPACKEELAFHNWIRGVTLVRDDDTSHKT